MNLSRLAQTNHLAALRRREGPAIRQGFLIERTETSVIHHHPRFSAIFLPLPNDVVPLVLGNDVERRVLEPLAGSSQAVVVEHAVVTARACVAVYVHELVEIVVVEQRDVAGGHLLEPFDQLNGLVDCQRQR